MRNGVVAEVLRVGVVPQHCDHIFQLHLPRQTGVNGGGQVGFARAGAVGIHPDRVREVVIANKVFDFVEVFADFVHDLPDAPRHRFGASEVFLQRLLPSDLVAVVFGLALLLAWERAVPAAGRLGLDQVFHLA